MARNGRVGERQVNRKQRRAQGKAAPGKAAPGQPARPSAQAGRLNEQALALYRAGRLAEAVAALRQAAALDPDHAPIRNNLGELLRLSGQLDDAAAELDRAVTLDPSYAAAHSNRGNLLRQLGRVTDARDAYLTAIRLKPNYPEALSNLATAQMDLGDFAGAAETLRKAIALNPSLAILHKNLTLALFSLGDLDGAEAAYAAMEQATVKLPQESVELAVARGDMARFKNNLDEALHYYEQAWRIQPGHAMAHMRYGAALMVKGEYRAAWPHFGARWNMPDLAVDRRPFTLPFWKGEAVPPGGKMLLFTEQGVGESLVLWSLLPELLARGITPVVETDPRMIPILARSFPGLELHARANPPEPRLLQPDLVVQATLFDLAPVFRQSPADCKGALPLRADPEKAAALRARYKDGSDRPLVGVAWHSGNAKLGAPKSAQLPDFAPFLALPGIRFVDLQYGNRAADRAALKAACGADILFDPAVDQLKDLEAFAAQVAAMDFVVSTSNTTAHMAAALGKPTWVLLHKGISPHWYWGLAGETTPWYPTARLLRQQSAGDWRGLAERVAAELPGRLASTTSAT